MKTSFALKALISGLVIFHSLNTKAKLGSQASERWFEPNSLDTSFILANRARLDLSFSRQDFSENYLMAKTSLDSLMNQYQNSYLSAQALEAHMLPKFSTKVTRDSQGLSLRLKNGQWLTVRNNSDFDEVAHSFEYFFEEFGYYSLRVQWSEGNAYKLVNAEDGSIIRLIGRPYFSPEGKYLIAISTDLEAGYSVNGFEVYTKQANTWKKLTEYHPKLWGPVDLKWISPQQAILRNQSVEIQGGNLQYFEFYSQIKISEIQNEDFWILANPQNTLVYGSDCGLDGETRVEGRKAIENLIDSGNIGLIHQLLVCPKVEAQIYATEALLKLNSSSQYHLTDADRGKIQNIFRAKEMLNICLGCEYERVSVTWLLKNSDISELLRRGGIIIKDLK